MATNPIKIFFNRQRQVIDQFNGSVSAIPPLGQNELRDITVQFGDPASDITKPQYSVVNMQAFALQMTIGLQPLGDGSVPILSGPTFLTWDSSANQFYAGQLDLRPSGISTALGTNKSVDMVLQFQVQFSGVPVQNIQIPVTIVAVENAGSSTGPTPAPAYLTTAQSSALFVTWNVPPGFAITFQTSDPKKQLTLSVNDNLEPVWLPIVSP